MNEARTPRERPWQLSEVDEPEDSRIGEGFASEHLASSYPLLYDELSALGQLFRSRQTLVFALLAECDDGGKLLDAGCGAGLMSRFILDHRPGDFTITALDRSHAMIDQARATIGAEADAEFVVGRVERMPFENATFDAAMALGVLEYVVDVKAAISELARVVRSGGLVVVSMQNRLSPYRAWQRNILPRMSKLKGSSEEIVERPVDERSLIGMLREAGLTPVDRLYYNFNVLLDPLDHVFPEFAMRVACRLAPLSRGPLRRLGADYLISARRD